MREPGAPQPILRFAHHTVAVRQPFRRE